MMHPTSRRQLNNNNSAMTDWAESSYNLHLDLYNFESVDADDSPYILTSPRSLEACTRLEIKPIELLHKDLSKFEEVCLLTGQPLSNAKVLYEEHEQQRLRKLKQCRHLREKIILEIEAEEDSRRNTPSKSSHYSPTTRSPKRDAAYSVKSKAVEFGQGDNRTSSLNIPQRPTSTRLLGQRSKSLSPTGLTSTSTPNCANMTVSPSRKHWRSTSSTTTYHMPTSPQDTSPRMRSQVGGHTERSMSSCSSRQSLRSRHSLASDASILSDQDQKILDLLEKKYKDEKLVEETRQEMRLAWDEQRQSAERSKVMDEMQRRKNLAEVNRIRQKKKEKQQLRRKLKNEQEIKDAEMEIQYQDMHHDRLVKDQQQLMRHQMQMKKLEGLEKKNRQERVLKKREEEEAEYRQAVSDHAATSQERADELRRQRENQEVMEHKRRNMKEKLRHSSLKASVDKSNEEYMDYLRDSILLKHSRSQHSLSNQQWLQEHEMRLNRQKEESLQERSRKLRQEMEDENRQWQRQLMYQSLMAQERAAQLANENVQSKASKAKQARRSRELTQKELKKRVDEDDALYKESVKMNLAYKDMKSRSLAAEKQDAILRSRVIAMESARLRDQLREQYQGSFDKMVQRADHQSMLGRGPRMSTKNFTTFTLT